MPESKNFKRIAFYDGIVAIEKLPFPCVYYPGFYGTFFAFAESRQGTLFLCSCSLVAIENYIRLKLSRPTAHYGNADREFLADSHNFPLRLVRELMNSGCKAPGEILNTLTFKDKLCHQCNKATPSYRYCHEMYGGVFKQNYGWYINKQALEYGIYRQQIDRSICPEEILDLVEITPETLSQEYQQLQENDFEKAREFHQKYRKQNRQVQNIIENEVRGRFGHKHIGEGWTSETVLYYIIRTLLPDREIIRHARPECLKGLELDIYIPELGLGVEYQGIQHYKPVKHWGGKQALDKYKERDQRKRELCSALGLDLIYFRYDEELSNQFVWGKLKKYCNKDLCSDSISR